MSLFLSNLSFRKRVLCVLLAILAALAALFHFFGFPLTEEQKFSRFTREVFCGELSGNTLNLHYTLSDPSEYGLGDCEPSLGDLSLASRKQSAAALENYRSTLLSFDYEKLAESQQLTYDIFLDYLDTELGAAPLLLYDEPLSPTLGIQAQLPILLAEYAFRTKGDIEDYLALLSQMPAYFSSVLSFEQEKADAGLFMSDENASAVIRQCRDFIQDPDSNYLTGIFNEKIRAVTNLTADEKAAYQSRNASLMASHVVPAYERLTSGLEALKGSGKNEMGLYYDPHGTEYYEYLVKSGTGDSRPIAEIEEQIKQQMVADFTDAKKLTQGGTSPLVQGNPEESDTEAAPSESAAQESAASPATDDPAKMLRDLRQKITADFPVAPAVNCQVKYVHASLQEYLSPAFYLTPTLDNYSDNVIYINPSSGYGGLELYTTLAHEGYPGHLYQTVCFSAQSPDPLRTILDTGGYTEGWATYVEMYAYSLWDGEKSEAQLAQKNRSFTLGLASLLDIGIHYRGYTPQQVASFLAQLGFGEDTAASLYQAILQSPANYLQYYVGYLDFCSLRDAVKERQGASFRLKEFHRAVLETGPAPFDLLEKQVYLKLGR